VFGDRVNPRATATRAISSSTKAMMDAATAPRRVDPGKERGVLRAMVEPPSVNSPSFSRATRMFTKRVTRAPCGRLWNGTLGVSD
jgi:hypothetical protein